MTTESIRIRGWDFFPGLWLQRNTGVERIVVGVLKPAPTNNHGLTIDKEDGDRIEGTVGVTHNVPLVWIDRVPASRLPKWDRLFRATLPYLRPVDFSDDWLINHAGQSDSQINGIGDHNPRYVTIPILRVISQ